MEYIEKRDSVFYAVSGNELKIDNVNIFDSRINYHGFNGTQLCIAVGDFAIEWISNFGYGSWSMGAAYVNFNGIFIKVYNGINTTEAFVNILNKYLNLTERGKDDLIIDLANRLAHFREISKHNMVSSINNKPSYSNPKFLRPTKKIDELTPGIDTDIMAKLRSMLEIKK